MSEKQASGASVGTVVGFDVGGSRTRALVMAPDGTSGARQTGPPAAVDPREPARTVAVIEEMLRRMEADGEVALPAAALCAGIAGAGPADVHRELEAGLRETGVARRVAVHTDGEVALHDAHGDGPGLLLVSSTGSVAWGRDAGGRIARAGGWGPMLGDEGSGYELARAALRRVVRGADGRAEPTDLETRVLDHLGLTEPEELIAWAAEASRSRVASLAPLVARAADDGLPAAVEIVERAVDELLGSVGAVVSRLAPWESPPALALTGGLLDPGGPLRDRVLERVRNDPGRPEVEIREAEVDPVRGAARLALRRAAEA